MFANVINVDISNIWGQISLPNLLAMEKEVFEAHRALTDRDGVGNDFLGWMDLPTRESTDELRRIQSAAARIRKDSDVCVVVGIGGSQLGAQAGIELLQGPNRNLTHKDGPQICYAGNSLSPRHWNELMQLLDGKDFSIIVISKSGATLEPAIALRGLRWMLERKYGTDGANSRIYAVTDPWKGALRQMADQNRWETFVIPAAVCGRYSVLTAAGLLPMAVAGIDILEVLSGAMDGKESYDLRSFENPVWLYAAVRNLLYRKGKAIEVFEGYEPGFRAFGRWWQQVFSESEGKDGKGLFPVPAEFTADLHSLGQMIQQGQRNLFETTLRFDPPADNLTILGDVNNLDGLNYLEGKTLDMVEEKAFQGCVSAHVDGGVSVITMDCGPLNPRKVGELFYFFQLSCAISAYLLEVNPFNQPGVSLAKRNMYELLGRPGFEQKKFI